MGIQSSERSDLVISPLTFLQIYQSTDTVMAALLEKDIPFQQWFLPPTPLRPLGKYIFLPLYYHFATSGYGAMVGNDLVGWLYLRGREQVLYVETLATRPDWRQKGIATRLLDFAEQQARTLKREWMALSVTLRNGAAISLYEGQGFERGHWRLLESPGGWAAPGEGSPEVALQPVFGLAADAAFRYYTEADLPVGDPSAATAMIQLIDEEPFRRPGRDWIVEVSGKPVAYINLHQASGWRVLYLAALPDWWGSLELLTAASMAASGSQSHPLRLRLGSSGHHDAAREAFKPSGFIEQPAVTARMFKKCFSKT